MEYTLASRTRVWVTLLVAALLTVALTIAMVDAKDTSRWLRAVGFPEGREPLAILLPVAITALIAIALVPRHSVTSFYPLEQLQMAARNWDIHHRVRPQKCAISRVLNSREPCHVQVNDAIEVDALCLGFIEEGCHVIKVLSTFNLPESGMRPLISESVSSPWRAPSVGALPFRVVFVIDATVRSLSPGILSRLTTCMEREGHLSVAICRPRTDVSSASPPLDFANRTTHAWLSQPWRHLYRSVVWGVVRAKLLLLLAFGILSLAWAVTPGTWGEAATWMQSIVAFLGFVFIAPALLTIVSIGLTIRGRTRRQAAGVAACIVLAASVFYNFSEVDVSLVIGSLAIALAYAPDLIRAPLRVLTARQAVAILLTAFIGAVATPVPGPVMLAVGLALTVLKWTRMAPLLFGTIAWVALLWPAVLREAPSMFGTPGSPESFTSAVCLSLICGVLLHESVTGQGRWLLKVLIVSGLGIAVTETFRGLNIPQMALELSRRPPHLLSFSQRSR